MAVTYQPSHVAAEASPHSAEGLGTYDAFRQSLPPAARFADRDKVGRLIGTNRTRLPG
jgi:hypothetical protein